ncbi:MULTISPECIES: bacteriocin immunity protein [Thiomicrorhabdus]|uniref:Flagellar hook-length control protein FliK n=1 Tax=Thiomicrorhabdus heinhorstiae TaxID=2748010 RepID=A0ABS0C217_9GAMM|nr:MULTISPECIES: bacteriocin immunity protein [Thiomicrorhabdus]MBF6058352.1 flagellar hook-length control protein FliK [Thiomicrorhabdus heinhorstiae]
MDISALNSNTLLRLTGRDGLANLLQIGQTLKAEVLQTQGNQVQLSIGNQTLWAQSSQTLNVGSKVNLTVQSLQPQIELRLTTANTDKAPNTQNLTANLQTAYRQFLPQQMPLINSFQQLNLMQPQLPATLQSALQPILDQLLKPQERLSGEALKQHLQNSGLFLESKLANKDQANLQQDLKAQLLQAKQTLESQSGGERITSQLSQALNQAVARITLQQLQLYEQPHITPFELPYLADRQAVKQRMAFKKTPQHPVYQWEVQLQLNLDEAELNAKIRMQKDHSFQIGLWSDDSELREKIENALPELETQFLDNALKLQSIRLIPQEPIEENIATKMTLIDLQV